MDAPNHLAGPPDDERIPEEVLGRALVVRQLEMMPVECVARGYLTGSGIIDYRKTGTVCGIQLPDGLTEASQFVQPLFTPASKAELGQHDENISFERVVDLVGAERATQLRDRTLELYVAAAAHALSKGIIIADTKFEFGVDEHGTVVLGRRGLHSRLVEVLAGRRLSGGRRAAQFRQAVRAQLAHRAGIRLGPRRRRTTAALAARHRRGHPRALHRSLRTHFGLELRRLDRTSMNPPIAKRVDTRREHHGDVFVDPYEWLRDKSNPDVIAYLEAENAYTDEQTEHLAPLRQRIFDEIKARTKETDLSVPTRRGDWWYYGRSFEGKQYGVQCRCPIGDPDDWTPPELDEHTEIPGEQILLDENVEAEGHDFFSLGAASVSLDGNTLAFSVDVVGDERYTLKFRNLLTGEMYDDTIVGIGAGATWAADNRTVYYVTVDDAWRPDTVWRHRLGSGLPGEQVYHEPDERFWLAVGRTRSNKYVFIAAGSAVTSEVFYGDAGDADATVHLDPAAA